MANAPQILVAEPNVLQAERAFVCRVLTQIVDALRPLPLAQIIGAANDHERERRRQPDDYHVWRDELAQTDTGIKPFGREVEGSAK